MKTTTARYIRIQHDASSLTFGLRTVRRTYLSVDSFVSLDLWPARCSAYRVVSLFLPWYSSLPVQQHTINNNNVLVFLGLCRVYTSRLRCDDLYICVTKLLILQLYNSYRRFSSQKPYYTNVADVPRSLQSWASTIQTVALTADVFQLFIKLIRPGPAKEPTCWHSRCLPMPRSILRIWMCFFWQGGYHAPVSYTHLTLPTICSV